MPSSPLGVYKPLVVYIVLQAINGCCKGQQRIDSSYIMVDKLFMLSGKLTDRFMPATNLLMIMWTCTRGDGDTDYGSD